MVGYAPSAAAFFIFVAAFCMFQLTSETVGTICAIICGNATYSILVRGQHGSAAPCDAVSCDQAALALRCVTLSPEAEGTWPLLLALGLTSCVPCEPLHPCTTPRCPAP